MSKWDIRPVIGEQQIKKFPVFTSSNNRVARLVTVACKAYE